MRIMKKIFFIFLLPLFIYLCAAEYHPITLPTKKILDERLNSICALEYFLETTNLTETLGGKTTTALDVSVTVSNKIINYAKIHGTRTADPVSKLQSEIIRLVLQDNQDALKSITPDK